MDCECNEKEGQSGLIYCCLVEMFAFANIFDCLSRQSFQHPTFNMLKSEDEFCWLCFEDMLMNRSFRHNERVFGGFVREDYENMSLCDVPISLEHDNLILF